LCLLNAPILAEPWIGLVAPAHTSVEIVKRLNREIAGVLQVADLQRRLEALSFKSCRTIIKLQPSSRRICHRWHARGLKLHPHVPIEPM
jgi:hypothetical protein